MILSLYIIITLSEWYIHKNLMHLGEQNIINTNLHNMYYFIYDEYHHESHINHHLIVQPNGEIIEEDKAIWFAFISSLCLIPLVFTVVFTTNKIISINKTLTEYIKIFLMISIISLTYNLLWNFLHPRYHRYGEMYNKDSILNNNFIYKYLEKYHMLHHFNKGNNKCNFNILLPGADFIMGTFKWCVDNIEYCKNNMNKTDKEIIICENQANGIDLNYGISYCN